MLSFRKPGVSPSSIGMLSRLGFRQQNLSGRRIAILELSTNDINRIQSARNLIEETLATLQSNEFKQLNIP